MFGLVLLLSVVARHRVMPGPGVCCDAGPVVRRDRPACECNPGTTGLRTGARSQLADASCGTEFTPLTCVLLPSPVHRTLHSGCVIHRWAAGAFRPVPRRAELG